jgi:hypothetical protein
MMNAGADIQEITVSLRRAQLGDGSTRPASPAITRPTSARIDLKDALGAVRDLSFIAAIYLFFSGFLYHAFVLDALGIPLSEREIPLNYLLVYGYEAVRRSPDVLVLAVGFVIAYLLSGLLLRRTRWGSVHMRETRLALALLAALIAFPLLYRSALAAAQDQVQLIRIGETGNTAYFTMKLTARQDYADLLAASAAGSLSIVAESESYYYVLAQKQNVGTCLVPDARVFVVPKADTQFVQISIPGFNRKNRQRHLSLVQIMRSQRLEDPCAQ